MADTKVYLPAQKSRRGVAGYRGDNNLVVVGRDGKEDKKATAAAHKADADRAKSTDDE
jgi:hypothetical protein